MSAQRGFTLIEMILVIVIISVVSIPLFGLYSQATSSLLDNESLQTATQLAQERAELVLSLRRARGYNGAPELAVGTVNENLAAPFAGYTRTTVISEPGTPPAGCPPGAVCKEVAITVTRNAQTLSALALLLVNY